VHDYAGERFAIDGNAFVLYGGSEGVYASAKAGAFIEYVFETMLEDQLIASLPSRVVEGMWLTLVLTRCVCVCSFEKVTFRRMPESATATEEDGICTTTVTTVIFKAGDCDTVGGADVSIAGGRALCCTRDMARLEACTEGAVTYCAWNGSTGWPMVLTASILLGGLDAAFPDETVAVARTDMYTLLFVHCNASLADQQVATVKVA
jgi:hypothetical protein